MGSQGTGRFRHSRISPPRVVGNHSLRLVARASGWRGGRALRRRLPSKAHGGRGDGNPRLRRAAVPLDAEWAGAWLRLTPTEVIVGEGETRGAVTIVDPTSAALRAMRKTALVVGVLGLVVPALVRWRR